MPHMVIKGMKEQEVALLSKEIFPQLSEIMETPEDWFVFEHSQNTYFISGQATPLYPMVHLYWFDRGQEIKDQTAVLFDEKIRAMGYEQIEIIFHTHKKEDYFENGTHY